MSANKIFDAFEALDDLYVHKDIYRDTQLRLDSGIDNIEDCIIQLSKMTQELCAKVRRLEGVMFRDNDFCEAETK